MKAHHATVGKSDTWLTPPEWIKALGPFDTDPACPMGMPWRTAYAMVSAYGLEDDYWVGRVWLNPPFNRYERPLWMKRMADHGNGIMLIPAATETQAFKDYVWDRADAVCFVHGRPHFHDIDGKRAKANCGTAIVLVAYGVENVAALHRAGLGRVVELRAALEAQPAQAQGEGMR